MPIYEYCCNECEQVFEEWQRNHDDVDVPCPVCGGQSHRIISNTSFVLKGSGWYVTDYADGRTSHGSAKSDAAVADDAKSKETKESKSTDSSESKAPPKAESTGSSKTESSSAQS